MAAPGGGGACGRTSAAAAGGRRRGWQEAAGGCSRRTTVLCGARARSGPIWALAGWHARARLELGAGVLEVADPGEVGVAGGRRLGATPAGSWCRLLVLTRRRLLRCTSWAAGERCGQRCKMWLPWSAGEVEVPVWQEFLAAARRCHGCLRSSARRPGRRPRVDGCVWQWQRGCRGLRCRDSHGLRRSSVVSGRAMIPILILLSLHGRIGLRAKALHGLRSVPTSAAL